MGRTAPRLALATHIELRVPAIFALLDDSISQNRGTDLVIFACSASDPALSTSERMSPPLHCASSVCDVGPRNWYGTCFRLEPSPVGWPNTTIMPFPICSFAHFVTRLAGTCAGCTWNAWASPFLLERLANGHTVRGRMTTAAIRFVSGGFPASFKGKNMCKACSRRSPCNYDCSRLNQVPKSSSGPLFKI